MPRPSMARSRFLFSISHELRTPLNGIIGFTDLVLMDEPDSPLNEIQRSNIEHVNFSGLV